MWDAFPVARQNQVGGRSMKSGREVRFMKALNLSFRVSKWELSRPEERAWPSERIRFKRRGFSKKGEENGLIGEKKSQKK